MTSSLARSRPVVRGWIAVSGVTRIRRASRFEISGVAGDNSTRMSNQRLDDFRVICGGDLLRTLRATERQEIQRGQPDPSGLSARGARVRSTSASKRHH